MLIYCSTKTDSQSCVFCPAINMWDSRDTSTDVLARQVPQEIDFGFFAYIAFSLSQLGIPWSTSGEVQTGHHASVCGDAAPTCERVCWGHP